MKKTRFLVLALVVAVMLMGAGYAWWNDTITVTTGVTTGNLDVNVSCPIPDDHSPFVTVDAKISGDDQVYIKVDDLYPGAYGLAYINLKNDSTMDVVLDNDVYFKLDNTDENGYGSFDDVKNISVEYTPTIGTPGIVLTKYDSDSYTYTGSKITIPKGQSALFVLKTSLPSGETGFMNCEKIGFTIKPNFIQPNASLSISQ